MEPAMRIFMHQHFAFLEASRVRYPYSILCLVPEIGIACALRELRQSCSWISRCWRQFMSFSLTKSLGLTTGVAGHQEESLLANVVPSAIKHTLVASEVDIFHLFSMASTWREHPDNCLLQHYMHWCASANGSMFCPEARAIHNQSKKPVKSMHGRHSWVSFKCSKSTVTYLQLPP